VAKTATQQPTAAPGSWFDVPGAPGGGTQWQETYETTNGLAVTLAGATQTTANGIVPFKQTDVVLDWFAKVSFTQTYTGGTGQTMTNSAYAPMNVFGAVQLLIQNQYSSVKVENGIDWYIFNLIRPDHGGFKGGLGRDNFGANPAGDPVGGTATGYYTTALAQANQFAATWANSSTAYELIFRLPASQWFDVYYDLAPTGQVTTAPHPAVVSPQYMAGTTRQITPSIVFNPGLGGVTDFAPVSTTTLTPTSDSATTYAGTATLVFTRQAIYSGAVQVLPPVYAWQYAWQTTRFSLSGVSKVNLMIPLESGQVLSVYVRMFDPSASSSIGAPININTVTKMQLQYGSGLMRFDDTPDLCQRRWFKQHGNLLPQGCFGWDLAIDNRGQMTNKAALNLLTTAGCLVHIEWTAALSSTAYAVLGIESLVYVS
jgi:hypothetical protein